MIANDIQIENRTVSGFDRVAIRGLTCTAQLFITQGKKEELTIQAPEVYQHRIRSDVEAGKLTIRLEGGWLQELQDALAANLSKPLIIYRLRLRDLTSLDVQCANRIYSPRIETPQLLIKFNGAGEFRLDDLSAKTLEVQHSGSGSIYLSGHVDEQAIQLNGVGCYIAPGLNSQRASVRSSGAGTIRLHVNQEMNANLRGVGILEYSGEAAIRKKISGMSQIVHLKN